MLYIVTSGGPKTRFWCYNMCMAPITLRGRHSEFYYRQLALLFLLFDFMIFLFCL